MFRAVRTQALVGVLAVIALGAPPVASQTPPAAPKWKWYAVKDGKVQIHLHIFWSSTCSHCADAMRFVDGLEKRSSWLAVHRYEVSANPANQALYREMAESLKRTAGTVPAFFYCKQLDMGFEHAETTGKRLERALLRCRDALQKQLDERGPPQAQGVTASVAMVEKPSTPPDDLDFPAEERVIQVPGWGEVNPADASLPALTIGLAALDSVNPCAFFVLTILLSLMLRTGSRARMLLVGGVFVLASGVMYFAFMAAWLNLFLLVGHVRWLTVAAGVVAVVIGLINVKDYFWFKTGVSLSIPQSAKPGLFRRMNDLLGRSAGLPLLGGAAALAFAANLYEVLCTSGLPMVYTRVLTLRGLTPAGYYGYLVLYNLVYVAPMALIVAAFSLTLSSHKLTEYQGRVLKLLSGVMMLALGVLLVIAPSALDQLAGAAGTVLGSVAVTAAIVLLDRARTGRPRRRSSEFASAAGPQLGP